MATLEEIVKRTRLELSDLKVPFYERVVGSGNSARFDLKGITNIEGDFFLYPLGDSANPLVEDTDYTLHRREGKVYFTNPPTTGEVYIAEGEFSKHFSDEEIELFVKTAFDMHTRGRNPKIGYSALPSHEVLLVAILAQIEALWVLKASSAYEINIHAPEGMFIPRGQRFEQLNMFLREVEARYKELSAAMGVGLYAVEMFNLRRVSRTTGRYVPVYLDREFDDTRPPQRVYPTISSQFEETPDPTIETEDIQLLQGRAFEHEFSIEDDVDMTASKFEVALLRTKYQISPYSREVLPEFEVETRDVPEDKAVIVRLTAEETGKLQSSGSYVYELRWAPDQDTEPFPVQNGKLMVEQGYPIKSTNVVVGR